MPTGYTEGIASGKVTSFEEYAMECARAFGALVTMRDEPRGTPINEFVPSDYTIKRVKDAKRHREEVVSRSESEWVAAYNKYVDETIEYRTQRLAECAEKKQRYTEMLEKAKRFIPPTKEHADYATFIVQQIETSIKHDCDTTYYENISIRCFADWKRNELDESAKELVRADKSLREERKRCKDRNKWVEQLRAAIAAVV